MKPLVKAVPAGRQEKVTLGAIGKLIEKSIGKLATKNELTVAISKLTTKEELAVSVSKLATKEEISKLATRDEMNEAIGSLAGAVKKGFDEVHGKFAKIDERFDVLERKVDRMDEKFTNQLDYFDLYHPTRNEFTNLDGRMKRVEKRLRMKA